jgi:hypothetical protein
MIHPRYDLPFPERHTPETLWFRGKRKVGQSESGDSSNNGVSL